MILALHLPPSDPGLIAWRKFDVRGQRCASCHSPDGIELSAFGFSRQDLLRRASRHLPAADAEAVAEMLRRRVGKFDPLTTRPLQPGGAVLPGETPSDRDFSFLRSLPKFTPTFALGRVDSEATALRVRDELLRIDLKSLPVGIVFNRLSEDAFHGPDHRSVANWLPDVPVAVSDAASNRYLAEPTDANLRALDADVKKQATSGPGEALAIAKYRSLLILQHQLRTGRLVQLALPGKLANNQNPFWDVADFARTYAAETDVAALRLPPEVAVAKQGGLAFSEQLKALRLPWFWMGWTLDPALQTSGLSGETQRGDYFVRYLWQDGPYPAHLAFMISKKLVEQGYNPRLWNNPRFPQRYEISFSGFLLGDDLDNLKLQGEYGKQFSRLAANALRAGMFLSRRSVRDTGQAFHPEAQANQVRLAMAYLRRIDPQPSDLKLSQDLLSRLAKAKPLR